MGDDARDQRRAVARRGRQACAHGRDGRAMSAPASSPADAPAGVLWLARAGNVLRALAAMSGIVTFLAFGWQLYKETRNARTEFAQAWQESEIFGVVFECRERGVGMAVIENELRRRLRAADVPGGVSADMVTGASVRRALMQLTERDILALRPDVTYAVPLDWPAPAASPQAVSAEPRPYGCHCYRATPEDAEIIPPHCAPLSSVAQGAAQKSGT
jgi:hypothetical protein